jgi:hypothetical protein
LVGPSPSEIHLKLSLLLSEALSEGDYLSIKDELRIKTVFSSAQWVVFFCWIFEWPTLFGICEITTTFCMTLTQLIAGQLVAKLFTPARFKIKPNVFYFSELKKTKYLVMKMAKRLTV